jgi:hypothetical protein
MVGKWFHQVAQIKSNSWYQLTDGPSFVATLLHPIFFTSGASRQILVHEDLETGEHSIERSIVMTRYWNVPPAKQMVFPGRKGETPVRSSLCPLLVEIQLQVNPLTTS